MFSGVAFAIAEIVDSAILAFPQVADGEHVCFCQILHVNIIAEASCFFRLIYVNKRKVSESGSQNI